MEPLFTLVGIALGSSGLSAIIVAILNHHWAKKRGTSTKLDALCEAQKVLMIDNVTAIETGGGTATLTVSYAGETDTTCIFVNADGSLIQSQDGTNTGQHTIPVPSLVLAVSRINYGPKINGAAENIFDFTSVLQGRVCTQVLVTGNASITY